MPSLKKTILIVCCSLILFLFQGKSGTADTINSVQPPLKVFVSILPTEYFVKRIAQERVSVESLVKPGYSPATYSPTPKQMSQLATTRYYFRIGVPFENAFLPKLKRSFQELLIVDLQQGIELSKMAETEDEHHHQEGEIDPHTWLDPLLALRQATIIHDTLIKADPEGRKEYETNFKQLAEDLKDLDLFLRKKLAPFKGSTVYVFHPAYGYFCQAYDLKQKAITPGGKEPGAKYIAHLIDEAQKERVKIIFVQPQFSDKAARTIARAIGGSVFALDPLAYDYIANMKKMADGIEQSLSEKIE